MESLSSSEMPGSEDMLMVNEPSLNLGRKLLPKEKNVARAATSSTAVEPITHRVWPNTHVSACW